MLPETSADTVGFRGQRITMVADGAGAVLLLTFLFLVLHPAVLDPFQVGPATAWTIQCCAFAVPILVINRAVRRRLWRPTPFDYLLCVYLGIAVATWPASVDRQATAAAIVRLAAQLAVYCAVRVLAENRPGVARVGAAALVAGIAMLEWTALNFHIREGLSARLVEFPPLEWNGREGLGLAAAIQLALVVGIWQRARSYSAQIASILLITGGVVELLFLYSRLAWVAAAAVMVVGLVTTLRVGGFRRYTIGLGVMLAIVGLVGTPYMAHLARLAVGAERGLESGLAWRAAAWLDGIRVIGRHMVVGVGLGNFMAFRQSLALPRLSWLFPDQTPALHPHNIYLQQMAEVGVMGGVAYLGLWATALWAGWRIATRRGVSLDTSEGFFYALVAIAVSNLAENMFDIGGERFRLHTIAWILIAFVIAEWNRHAPAISRASIVRRHPPAYRVLFVTACVVLAAYQTYAVFLSESAAVAIEGYHRRAANEFGHGARVSQAFRMVGNGLTAAAVQFSTDRSLTLLVRCELSQFQPNESGAPPYEAVATYRWFVTIKRVAGGDWRRISFPALDESDRRWYVLRLELIQAVPADDTEPPRGLDADPALAPRVGLVVSTDNVFGGGALWIGDRRQVGSLSLHAFSSRPTAYERWRADMTPRLPPVLRHTVVAVVVAAAYQLALLEVIYILLMNPGVSSRERLDRA